MKTKSVIIIGAGIGGFVAATHLAKRGLHVTVVEKNPHPGGRCDRLSREGHYFDTGPTLFVMPLLYEAEFRRLEHRCANSLTCNVSTRPTIWSSITVVNLPSLLI